MALASTMEPEHKVHTTWVCAISSELFGVLFVTTANLTVLSMVLLPFDCLSPCKLQEQLSIVLALHRVLAPSFSHSLRVLQPLQLQNAVLEMAEADEDLPGVTSAASVPVKMILHAHACSITIIDRALD